MFYISALTNDYKQWLKSKHIDKLTVVGQKYNRILIGLKLKWRLYYILSLIFQMEIHFFTVCTFQICPIFLVFGPLLPSSNQQWLVWSSHLITLILPCSISFSGAPSASLFHFLGSCGYIRPTQIIDSFPFKKSGNFKKKSGNQYLDSICNLNSPLPCNPTY